MEKMIIDNNKKKEVEVDNVMKKEKKINSSEHLTSKGNQIPFQLTNSFNHLTKI